ncbi:hypothetical protein HYY75_04710 [bacterium]|nr:hypothetical protein [bacterium]
MVQRRYSIKEIQRITQLSPATLKDLLKRYQNQINIEIVEGAEGSEIFLDHPAFERLIFIKQLEFHDHLSYEAIVNQLKAPISSNESKQAVLEFEKINKTLDVLSIETKKLGKNMRDLLLRYNQVLRDLNLYKAENRHMKAELTCVRKELDCMMDRIRLENEIESLTENKKAAIN